MIEIDNPARRRMETGRIALGGGALGMGGVGSEELMGRYISTGVRFILAANDLGLAMAAAAKRSSTLREFET